MKKTLFCIVLLAFQIQNVIGEEIGILGGYGRDFGIEDNPYRIEGYYNDFDRINSNIGWSSSLIFQKFGSAAAMTNLFEISNSNCFLLAKEFTDNLSIRLKVGGQIDLFSYKYLDGVSLERGIGFGLGAVASAPLVYYLGENFHLIANVVDIEFRLFTLSNKSLIESFGFVYSANLGFGIGW